LLQTSTWRSEPLIEVVGVEPAWSERQIIAWTSFSVYQNQSGFGGGLIGFDRQRRKFVLLSASHSTRVSTPITSISGPGLHVDGYKII